MTGATALEVRPLFDRYHYLGGNFADPIAVFADRAPGGLFGDTGEPIAAAVYASPANRYFGNGAVELVRLVRCPNYPRQLSQFVAWSLRWLRRNTAWRFCISYADTGAGHHGGIYQALGFVFVGESKGHAYWEHPATGGRCSARSFDQRRPALRAGWQRRAGTKKYLYVQPLKEQRRDLLRRFGWTALPYPKPSSHTKKETTT